MSHITVRRASVADAPAYARITGHPQVMAQLMQLPFTDEAVWRHRLGDMTAIVPGKTDVHLVAERNAQVVGTAGMHTNPGLRRRHTMQFGISVAYEEQGTGVGSALMQALCDYADQWAQVLRLELTVYADNLRAIALYRKFGFEHEGLHRGYALRSGEYVDVITMARLHPNPPRIARAQEPAA